MTTTSKSIRRSNRPSRTAAWMVAGVLALSVGAFGADEAPAATSAPLATETAIVHGTVLAGEVPIEAVKVYAYDIGNFRFDKVVTDAAGRFLFRSLPAGLYKVIAIKDGFLPSIQLLRRWQKAETQRLDLVLAPSDARDPREGESYWAVRSRIPADVLRDAAHPWSGEIRARTGELDATFADLSGVDARISAQAGIAHVPDGYEGQLTAANIGLRGKMGDLEIGLQGSFQQISGGKGSLDTAASPRAQQRGLALEIKAPGDHRVELSSTASAMDGLGGGQLRPVDLEHHRLAWAGPALGQGRVGITASLTEESGYFQPGWIELANLPSASRTLDLAGQYSRNLDERTSIAAGIRYQERKSTGEIVGADPFAEQRVDVFGSAGSQIQPRVMVEVGLYSRVRDGSLSLMPRGSFVIDLGNDWKARTSVAHRFERVADTVPVIDSFDSARFGDAKACQRTGQACYEVFFSHGDEERGQFSVGAIHREYADTLRLYFNDDFFNRLESLVLVRGDQVPEVQLSWARRFAPKILARLQSSYAEGGGGLVYATDDRSYKNAVRYLVTSIDTRFERTSTGVFVAFHHLEQSLTPLSDQVADAGNHLELDRLQLMLTQDLDILTSLPSNWAVRLNMELSRGSTPYTLELEDELMKTLTGGIAVRF